jgi:hypothetical protein
MNANLVILSPSKAPILDGLMLLMHEQQALHRLLLAENLPLSRATAVLALLRNRRAHWEDIKDFLNGNQPPVDRKLPISQFALSPAASY